MIENRSHGFSLIEVTLAIGIIAFGLIAILGLVPVGLNAAKDAADDTRTSLIAQDVFNRVRGDLSTNTTAVPVANLSLRWLDASGNLQASPISYTSIANASYGITTPAANAYYDSEGLFLNESADYARNSYKARIFIRPLATGTYPPNLQPSGSAPNTSYPMLSVVVKLGWPTEAKLDGKILPTDTTTQATYTFLFRKP